jgi:hypothetical protein
MNPDIHRRRSIRLRNYDYSQAVGTRHAVPLQRAPFMPHRMNHEGTPISITAVLSVYAMTIIHGS